MGSVFLRRFLSDPGNAVLLDIESVNILDLTPPAAITGSGSGTVHCTAELENGPFNDPVEVTSADDFIATFGGLGYTYAGVVGNNPCAVSRKADGAVAAELWNGNGFVQLNGKKFSRLILTRVDTSVGTVVFTALPFIVGLSAFKYTLVSGQTVVTDVGGGPVTSTFTGTAATTTAPSNITAFSDGDVLQFAYDGNPVFNVTFLASDNTAALAAARINFYAGFTFADLSGGKIRLTGRVLGTSGAVSVTGAGGILTELGFSGGPASASGGGNVANIAQVTVAEANTIIHAAAATINADIDAAGRIRLYTTSVSLKVTSASTATAFGFTPLDTVISPAVVTGAIIPAGTVVQNAGATRIFVTMQDVVLTAGTVTGYRVKVRHAVDDGTGLSAATNTVAALGAPIGAGSFSVANDAGITAALSEAAIDAQYVIALAATLDPSSVAAQTNISFAARQSNQVRRSLKQNALDASANGLLGRVACARTPMGVTKAAAQSTVVEPGVGAYRDQRLFYNWPQEATFVPQIALRGAAGGTGFNASGIVDVGADGFLASILSQLAPEENPGQVTPFMGGAVSLESSPNAAGLQMQDYINLKAAGICAPRFDNGDAIFHSGVTSVDPSVYPALVNISRRRMTDFLEDSLASAARAFGKKLNTPARRQALVAEFDQFLGALVSKNNPAAQRIDSYSIDAVSGNTKTLLGQGMFRIIIKIRLLSSLDSIVLQVTAGEQVTVDEVPQAA